MPQETRKRTGPSGAYENIRKKQRPTASGRLSEEQPTIFIDDDQENLDPNDTDEPAGQYVEIEQMKQAAKVASNKLEAKLNEMSENDAWPKDFARKIDDAEVKLKNELNERMIGIQGERKIRTGALSQILEKAIVDPFGPGTTENHSLIQSTKADNTSLHIASTGLLLRSKELLQDYEALAERLAVPIRSVDLCAKNKRETERLANLIKIGKAVTYAQSKDLLENPEGHTSLNRFDTLNISKEDEADIKAILNAGWKKLDAREQEPAAVWGDVAHDALKAFDGLSGAADGR